jgi:hypothetical protein
VEAATNNPVSGTFSFDYYDNTTSTDLGSTAPTNSGSYKVTATFNSTDPDYASGGQVSSTFAITLASITYTIGNDSQTYGHPANLAADLGTTIATGVNGENLDIRYSSTGDTATAIAGNYAITGTLSNGTGLLSNYTVTLNSGTLTVNAASTTTTITSTNVSIPFNSNIPQSVLLSASVASTTGGTVSEGSVTFTVGTLTATGNVSGGIATATLTLPAGIASGNYLIQASYADPLNVNGSPNFAASVCSFPGDPVVFPIVPDVAESGRACRRPASAGRVGFSGDCPLVLACSGLLCLPDSRRVVGSLL